MNMFCSIIIPTIGRSSLERSVKCVLEQDLKTERFEVIVVNDSGKRINIQGFHKIGHVG